MRAAGPGGHLRLLPREHGRRRHPLLGHRRPGLEPAGRLARSARPIRSTTTSRWTAPPRPSPARACCASAAGLLARGDARGARYRAAGLRRAGAPAGGAVPRALAPGHQGLLLHSVYHRPNGWDHVPAGPHGALRRVQHVGRLPPAGGGAVRAAAGRRRTVPDVLEDEGGRMTIADLSKIAGRTYPARRRTQNLVGGASPHPGGELLHGLRHPGARRRPGALAQPGAGGGLLHRARAPARPAWGRSARR